MNVGLSGQIDVKIEYGISLSDDEWTRYMTYLKKLHNDV